MPTVPSQFKGRNIYLQHWKLQHHEIHRDAMTPDQPFLFQAAHMAFFFAGETSFLNYLKLNLFTIITPTSPWSAMHGHRHTGFWLLILSAFVYCSHFGSFLTVAITNTRTRVHREAKHRIKLLWWLYWHAPSCQHALNERHISLPQEFCLFPSFVVKSKWTHSAENLPEQHEGAGCLLWDKPV